MKDHSVVQYCGCSAGVKCLLLLALASAVLCLNSDTEPEALQNSLSVVSVVEFKGNTVWSLLIQSTLRGLFLHISKICFPL